MIELLDQAQTIEGLDILCTMLGEPNRRWHHSELPGAQADDPSAFADALHHRAKRGLITLHSDGTVQSVVDGARAAALHLACRLSKHERPNVLATLSQLSIERVRSAAYRTFVVSGRRNSDDD